MKQTTVVKHAQSTVGHAATTKHAEQTTHAQPANPRQMLNSALEQAQRVAPKQPMTTAVNLAPSTVVVVAQTNRAQTTAAFAMMPSAPPNKNVAASATLVATPKTVVHAAMTRCATATTAASAHRHNVKWVMSVVL